MPKHFDNATIGEGTIIEDDVSVGFRYHSKCGSALIGKNGIPRGAVRDMMVGFYEKLLQHCDSMHVVIEGSEFEQSIKRSVIASVMLQLDTRGRIFIEGSLERVHHASPLAVRPELVRAAQVADERHLFDFARAADDPEDKPA